MTQKTLAKKPQIIRVVFFVCMLCILLYGLLGVLEQYTSHSEQVVLEDTVRKIKQSDITIDSLGTTVRKISDEFVLKVHDTYLNVILANDSYKRQLGLSGMEQLGYDTVIVFLFDTEGYQGFWMKDMNFPIDIVWLDSSFKVVHIEHNLHPETFPKTFVPRRPARYVIEMNAGKAKEMRLSEGDTVQLLNK